MIKLGMLSTSAAVLAVGLGALMTPRPAHAEECILDTLNDGVATNGFDTDGSATSSNSNDVNLACGINSNASGSFSTALGFSANAT